MRTGVTDPAGITPVKHYLAHVRRNEDGSFEIHQLEEHLRAVADLTGELRRPSGIRIGGDSLGLA